jgi:hypothetical protein
MPGQRRREGPGQVKAGPLLAQTTKGRTSADLRAGAIAGGASVLPHPPRQLGLSGSRNPFDSLSPCNEKSPRMRALVCQRRKGVAFRSPASLRARSRPGISLLARPCARTRTIPRQLGLSGSRNPFDSLSPCNEKSPRLRALACQRRKGVAFRLPASLRARSRPGISLLARPCARTRTIPRQLGLSGSRNPFDSLSACNKKARECGL